ncbi:MAG: hypothetical protein A2W93_16110 [Bacteroidetes bacterium GWF2_43_63]|nr:MAG: hypothetical protein A2W94_11105 [Bacteroidetes bacterium GWE2_42_42]OFY54249.1 MAG: hypothetical protein A2W93_16110 [Bacteroidetes bacterium GWF2_43_63]HBG69357.1 hypothetical protein [Bacteroidales bacterium]HCB60410.1 hypothetical protein [Bacteroidales bacterium]HCY23603.1 hypothetical protein [Bacteroidales bacterium]
MKPHIVFLAAWYPDEHDPMFGLFVHKHAVLLTKDFNVSVLHVTNYSWDGNGLFLSEKDGVSIIRLNISTQNRLLRWIYFFVAGLKAYRYICKKEGRPVLNHVHVLTRMGVLAAWIKCRRGIPFVITEHWSRYCPENSSFNGVFRKAFTRCVTRKAAAISTVSLYLARHMHTAGLRNSKPYSILRNVVDESVFKLKNSSPDKQIKSFINVSCFENKSKNIRGMLDAIKELILKRTDFQLILVGTGIDFDEMVQYSEQIGISEFVRFTGLLAEAEVADLLVTMDFYVQSSFYETSSVVIAEALTCGLPVVSTAVAAVPEIVNSSNGYLVNSTKSTELAAAIDLMLDSHKDFDSQQIRQNALNLFSKPAVLKQFNEFYTDTLIRKS